MERHEGDDGRSLWRDRVVFFALLSVVIWLTNSFLSRPAWAPANGLVSIAAATSYPTKLSMLSPRGIGSWSADQTANSTQYGMLRSSWRRRPRRPCGGISKLSSAQSRSHGKRGSNITHTGRRSADRTNFPASGGPVRTNFPASGGPVQSLPDLPRSGLRAPEGDEGRSLCRDISVVFALISVVVWATNSFLSRPAWAPANILPHQAEHAVLMC